LNKLILLSTLIVISAFGQAEIGGLTVPSGAVNMSAATTTKPMKSGTSLPGTCSVGEFYNKTDATNTAVIYACTATDTWTAQGGGGGGTTYTPGNNVSIASDVISVTGVQDGQIFKCAATQATTQTCTMTPTLAAYTNQQVLVWSSSTTCSGSPTLNIDGLGAKNVYENDGTTAASCTANQPYLMTYETALNGGSGGFRKAGGGGSSIGMARSINLGLANCNTSDQPSVQEWSVPSGGTGATLGCTDITFPSTPDTYMVHNGSVPVDWNGGTITLKMFLTVADYTAPHVVRMRGELSCSYDAASNVWTYLTAVTATLDPAVAETVHSLTLTFSTVTNCTAGGMLNIKVSRDVSVADDSEANAVVRRTIFGYTAQ
jgi:hypothetical protein